MTDDTDTDTDGGGEEWKNMRVKTDAWKAAREAKGEDETWSAFIRRCAESPRLQMSETELRAIIREEIDNRVVDQAIRR